tara:strand:+ start:148313 stop:149674 length:1362 start_codon:yes stop_codon:yes gene_type:complete
MSHISRLAALSDDDARRKSASQRAATHGDQTRNDMGQKSQLSIVDLREDPDDDWPDALEDAAFHGLAGEFIDVVLPETEADAAALLFHLLGYSAAMIGRERYFPVSGTNHHARLFSVAVGGTSSGRKGTALDAVSHVFAAVDLGGEFAAENVVSGLTSGAGLVWHVRDRQDGEDFDEVDDKRLLVIESEFGGVLKVCQRKENDLSAVIRDAWDGKSLRSLAKREPARATHPHINLIGHVTREELRATLSKVDVSNGFANRILWYAAKRSKLLPDGGELHLRNLSNLTAGILRAVAFGQTPGRMVRTDKARNLWHDVYGKLTAPRPGIFGQVTTRAEAQVLRLSMLYAILDESNEIDEPHIEAALAVWAYSEASARWAFGGSLGNRTADEILLALREVAPRGLSSTELSGLFNRNKSASEIREALGVLDRSGLIRRDSSKGKSAGRPAVTYFAS